MSAISEPLRGKRFCVFCGIYVDEPHRCEDYVRRTSSDPVVSVFREGQKRSAIQAGLPAAPDFVGGWRSGKRAAAE